MATIELQRGVNLRHACLLATKQEKHQREAPTALKEELLRQAKCEPKKVKTSPWIRTWKAVKAQESPRLDETSSSDEGHTERWWTKEERNIRHYEDKICPLVERVL